MRGLPHFRYDRTDIVVDESIRQTGRMALLAADQAPDRRPVGGIQLGNPGFLLNDLRTVHSQAGLTSHNQVTAQRRRQRHTAEAADHSGNDTDHGDVPAQGDNGRMNFGNDREAQVGFLQPDTTRFEQQYRHDRQRTLTVA